MKFRPAKRETVPLVIGLAGPSGSGKTFSALRMATGIVSRTGGRILMIDTEAKRGLHYADDFEYEHAELDAPFSPAAYKAALLKAQEDAGRGGVCIVDSMSHEHEGPGGVLEMHEAELNRMSKGDFAKRDQVKFAAWIGPKREHNLMVHQILQLQMHCIFCFRAKEKMALVRNAHGKVEPQNLGWQPIIGDRFEYEMLALLTLPLNARGTPDMSASKYQGHHERLFGQQINEELGQKLVDWSSGKGAKPKKKKAAKSTERDPAEPITPEQVAELERLITESGADADAFLSYFGLTKLSDMPGHMHAMATKKLKQKLAQTAPTNEQQQEALASE